MLKQGVMLFLNKSIKYTMYSVAIFDLILYYTLYYTSYQLLSVSQRVFHGSGCSLV